MINTDEPYILYADKRKSVRDLNKRMLLMLPLLVLEFVLFGAFSHGISIPVPHSIAHTRGATIFIPGAHLGFLSWFPWLLVPVCIVLYVATLHSIKMQSNPVVMLNHEGISVDVIWLHVGLIRWDEIKDIRAYNLIYRNVGVVPKDTAALCRRAGMKGSWTIRLNDWVHPLNQGIGIFTAPINIPQDYLPITADELLRTIDEYRLAYSPLPAYGSPQDGVWPPPPDTGRTHVAHE